MRRPAAPACWAFLAFWTKEQEPRSAMRMNGDGQALGLLVLGSTDREGYPEVGSILEESQRSVSV